MSREQIISHIQRNINVSISPNVISLAKSLADNPDVSALNELNKNGDLSPVMSAYVSEVDKTLTTSTLVARTDGWVLVKAVYSAGWYYATMFWKEKIFQEIKTQNPELNLDSD